MKKENKLNHGEALICGSKNMKICMKLEDSEEVLKIFEESKAEYKEKKEPKSRFRSTSPFTV